MNETKQSNNKKILVGIVALAVLILGLTFAFLYFREKAVEGHKKFTVEVVDDKGISTVYQGTTEEEYLRKALEEIEGLTIEGDESEYGLYVKRVNGVEAIYENDGAYWSFYVNDGYMNNGIDTQPVIDGDQYKIAYESSTVE